MARRYDSRTTIFSPEGNRIRIELKFIAAEDTLSFQGLPVRSFWKGWDLNELSNLIFNENPTFWLFLGRLYQVEYALEAISHAGTCLGIMATDGIVLAAEKKVTSKLLEQISHEKLYILNEYIPLFWNKMAI